MMDTPTNVAWLIKGRITDRKEFDKITKQLAEETALEAGSALYWWALNKDGDIYYDLDCYKASPAGMQHLSNWAIHANAFNECATIDSLTVYGDPSDDLRAALESLNPIYMNFYGGFWKEDAKMSDKDIIWMFDGEITNPEKYKEAMETLTKYTFEEEGSRSHWWTISPDGTKFNVIERYANPQAALMHIPTWMKYGHLFMESTQISEYKVLSDLTLEIKNDIASLDPKLLKFYMGFSK